LEARLHSLDFVVIAAYFVVMLAVGVYYARRSRTASDYLLGGRTMRPFGVGLSLFASLLSSLTYLAFPGEIIRHGPVVLAFCAAFPFVYVLVGWFIIPRIMKLRITSAYELLELRLGLGVRLLASLFFLAMRLMWMAVIIFAMVNTVLLPLLGLDPPAAPFLCAMLGIITIAYTAMGGLRAVVLTDVLQSIVLFSGALLTVVLISIKLGGPQHWWPREWPEHWTPLASDFISLGSWDSLKNLLFARMTFLSAALAHLTWWICTSSSDQIAVQRYLATRDAKGARQVLLTTLIADAVIYVLLAAVGLALLAYIGASIEGLAATGGGRVEADSLFPRFIATELPTGLSGLIIAGLLAAAMSSLSSGVNSSCSVITTDLLERGRGQILDDRTRLRAARWSSVVVGAIVVLLTSVVSAVEGNLLELAFKIVNLLTAPLFGLFFMAMFVRRATTTGTLIGAAAGLAVAVIINFCEELTGQKGISFVWAMPFSLATQIAVGVAASYLQRPER
jgi:SSS family solute:Na+ symporter